MARFLLLPIFLGLAIIGHGCDEFRMARLSQAVPTAVELADLEDGKKIYNAHIRLGEHIRLYDHTVYRSRRKQHEAEGPQNRVTESLVPVISSKHPFLKRAFMLIDVHGSLDKLPKDVKPPKLTDVAVLIRTDRFQTVAAIPRQWQKEASCQGLVINQIQKLNNKQIKLVRDSFPDIQIERVLILEEGRRPSSKFRALLKILTGLLFWVGTVVIAYFMWRRNYAEPSWDSE